MKKTLINGILAVLGLLLVASISFATETNNPESCQGYAAVAYVEYFGGGDTADVVYNNVFTRFVPAQDNAQGFWFYVYKKGKVWLCDGANAENYDGLPQYVTVRVYEGQQEEALRAKYNTYGVGYIITDHGAYTPFYFNEGGQAHFVFNYLKPDTIILSAPTKGGDLVGFQVDAPLRQENCGEETPKFMEMLNAFALL